MGPEIIGRSEELLAFDEFLEAVPAGGQALLFEGDAGIGKTVLWQEANRLARERGFRVLTGRSRDSGGSQSNPFPSARSVGFSGVGLSSACRDRSWCECTRSPVETRSSRSSSGARSPGARSARIARMSPSPRA